MRKIAELEISLAKKIEALKARKMYKQIKNNNVGGLKYGRINQIKYKRGR